MPERQRQIRTQRQIVKKIRKGFILCLPYKKKKTPVFRPGFYSDYYILNFFASPVPGRDALRQRDGQAIRG
jgi:hypothetical protein